MASNFIPREFSAVQSRDPRNQLKSSSSIVSQPLMDDSIKFHELRKTFSHLRTLIYATYPVKEGDKYVSDEVIKDEIKKVTETLDCQFENVCRQMRTQSHGIVAGQKSIREDVNRVERMVRQMSEDEIHRLEKQIEELRAILMHEQRLKEEVQCDLDCKQRETEELKKRLHEAETRAAVNTKDAEHGQAIQQLNDSLADLTHQVRASVQMGYGPRYTRKLRSRSYDEVDTVGDDLYLLSSSCVTLDDLNLSRESDEVVGHGYRQRLERNQALSRSTTTIDTKDTGFSDASIATNEAFRALEQKISKILESTSKCPRPARGSELPMFIRGFCVNIQECVFSPDRSRINQFSRSLGVHIERLQTLKDELDYRQDLPSLFWALIYEWNSLCEDKGTKATMLNQLIQACDDCRIPNPLDVKPMPTKDRFIIERNYSYLVEHLMVHPVLVYLRDSQSLTSCIVSYVLEPEPNPERVLRLVDILPVCGHNALDIFVRALRQSRQGHIADHIVASHPNRFSGNGSTSASYPVEDRFSVFPRQDIQHKKRRGFKWRNLRPFKLFKSKTYKMNQVS